MTRTIPSWVYWGGIIVSMLGSVFSVTVITAAYNQQQWFTLGVGIGYLVKCMWIFVMTQRSFVTIVEKPSNPIQRFTPSDVANASIGLPRGEYVYILQDVSVTGYCKIGHTNEPYRRLHNFMVKLPMDLSVVHIIKTSNRIQLETSLHRHYRNQRVNGEWFDLTSEDIEQLKQL